MRNREFNESTVLKKVTSLFWEKGYNGVSTRDLGVATGLSRASLYNAYESKAGLFRLVLNLYIQNILQLWTNSLSGNEKIEDELCRLCSLIIGEKRKKSPAGCFLILSTMELKLHDSDTQKIIKSGLKQIQKVVEKRMLQALEEGDLKNSIDPNEGARFVVSTVMGALMLHRAGVSGKELEKISSLLVASLPIQI